ncbi:helix-turn-helix domain-containing protein [Marinibaculum pumilum]|uniref:Helix-turn-helix domain-containing protein n=1 Tax=Marinibaculum pumilum TaxID=1766165 RepID=A0ABV7KU63_9PROT
MSSERSRRIALLEQRKSKDLGFHDPDPDARGTGIYSGIGDVLRQARERRGLTLQEVAAHLRISESYLAAIECGRFSQLPGRSYVLGFLRSYGKFLDLNPDKVVAQYKAEDDDDFARKQQLKFPTVRPEGRTPGLWLLPVVTIVAAVGYLGWYGWKTDLVSFDAIVPDVPARLQAESGPTADAPAAGSGTAADAGTAATGLLDRRDGGDTTGEEMRLARNGGADAAETAAAARAGEPAADAATAAPVAESDPATGTVAGGVTAETRADPGADPAAIDTPSPDTATTDATAADASEPPPLPSDPAPQEGQVQSGQTRDTAQMAAAGNVTTTEARSGMPSGDPAGEAAPTAGGAADAPAQGRVFGTEQSRVVLRANADTWVQVEDAQRNLLLTRVLKAGDIYRAPNQSGLVLMTGNAGGLVVEVDGEAIPSLGPRGAVRRNVSLDPERLLDGSQLVN